MKRLIIVCEGPTENEFCNDVIAPAFLPLNILVDAPLIKRSQGGIVSWESLKRQIIRHLYEHDAYVSMLIDYYGIKDSFKFPAWKESKEIFDKTTRMKLLNQAMLDDIPSNLAQRFIPYIQLHEFESLLFSDISVFTSNFTDDEVDIKKLEEIDREFANPEDINNSPLTAPSKRLLQVIPGYEKVLYGSYLAMTIGLNKIMERCPLFADWIRRLESISQ